jgi:hypothetical protein
MTVDELTARHIPPTREMIANFASAVVQEPVSESWVTRFISKYSIDLISQYSTGMDADRHNADSYAKYELYFNLLQQKITQYKVDAEHTYNMDEKGFMIGVTSRTKHVFSKRMWEKKEVKASLQDGNRAWVTLIACVCGDGSALPPGLLYESANNTIQSRWVEEIKAEVHSVLVSSSWTSTFTEGLILRSFEATGISPLQPNVILQRFAKDTPEASDSSKSSS